MATFEVSPADLLGLAGQLSGLLGELQQAAATVNSGAAGSAQNSTLEAAISRFMNDWNKGLDNLQEDLGAVSQRLDAAGGAYEAVEGSIGSAFGS
jgi:uncharacterized protein YukE